MIINIMRKFPSSERAVVQKAVSTIYTMMVTSFWQGVVYIAVICVLHITSYIPDAAAQHLPCLVNGRFYRNPDRAAHKVWTDLECSRYYLCLDGEVFDFRCSDGLLFDINRQQCDFRVNVNNCDVTAEAQVAQPLLDKANCTDEKQLGCSDGVCLPQEYFCDGSIDCTDGSDEQYCNSDNDRYAAMACNVSTCRLPNCFCSPDGTETPGRIPPSEIPQMIILTFDDAINFENWDIYEKLFTGNRKNPNGCPIRATFFVSHQFNNHYLTQKLWNNGHEIAVHSVTHRGPEEWWANNATIEDLFDEMVGQANIIHKFANIPLEEIRGVRVPFLSMGWNRQFLMMKEFGFVYDSSMIVPFTNPPLWPYTLDHKIPHRCMGKKQRCPTRSYPNVWEMVINQLVVDNKYTCAMVDSCPTNISQENTYTMLVQNFKRHYLRNRAPYGLYFHSTWFRNSENLIAFQKFLDEVLKQPNVWFVTNWQAIQWIQRPKSVQQIYGYGYKPWDCGKIFKPSQKVCTTPNICKLSSRILKKERYLYTCSQCPKSYPWIRNEFGLE